MKDILIALLVLVLLFLMFKSRVSGYQQKGQVCINTTDPKIKIPDNYKCDSKLTCKNKKCV